MEFGRGEWRMGRKGKGRRWREEGKKGKGEKFPSSCLFCSNTPVLF